MPITTLVGSVQPRGRFPVSASPRIHTVNCKLQSLHHQTSEHLPAFQYEYMIPAPKSPVSTYLPLETFLTLPSACQDIRAG
jgi:hypothetical protein